MSQRAGRFDLQAGDRVRFVGRCGDADVANSNSLHNDFGFLPLVQNELFRRVDLLLCCRRLVAQLRDDLLGPFESLLVGHSILQRHPLLGHRKRDVAPVGDLSVGLHRDVEQTACVLVDGLFGIPLVRLRVVPSPNVSATAV